MSIPNPFLEPGITSERQIWSQEIIDYPEYNSAISDTIFQALRGVKGVVSIAVTGEPGVGKSQIFSRVRHKTYADDSAICAYVNVGKIINLDRPAFYTLQIIIESLSKPNRDGVTVLQEIATDLVNQALAEIKSNRRFTPLELVEQFNNLAKNNDLVEKLTMTIQQTKPYLANSSNTIRAILWTLSAPRKQIISEEDFFANGVDAVQNSTQKERFSFPTALDWLKGNEISDDFAKLMRLPAKPTTSSQNDEEFFERLLQLIKVVADYKSLIICFDELDTLNANAKGDTTPKVIANLIRLLHENVNFSNPHTTFLILSLWLPETWDSNVKHVQALPDRGCSYSILKKEPLRIATRDISLDAIKAMIRYWLQGFNISDFPFSEAKLANFALSSPTPRKIWQWCAENWPDSTQIDVEQKKIEQSFDRLLQVVDPNLTEDEDQMAEILYFCFNQVKGQLIEKVLVEAIDEDIALKKNSNKRIRFAVIGKENEKKVKIGISIYQKTTATEFKTILQHLQDYRKYD